MKVGSQAIQGRPWPEFSLMQSMVEYFDIGVAVGGGVGEEAFKD
jgi:hypothetical protein